MLTLEERTAIGKMVMEKASDEKFEEFIANLLPPKDIDVTLFNEEQAKEIERLAYYTGPDKVEQCMKFVRSGLTRNQIIQYIKAVNDMNEQIMAYITKIGEVHEYLNYICDLMR